MDIGDRIRIIRQKLGTTQMELANRCGIHFSQLNKYERDEIKPSVDALRKLAIGLEVSADWLLFGDEDEEPERPPRDPELDHLFGQLRWLDEESIEAAKLLLDALVKRAKVNRLVNHQRPRKPRHKKSPPEPTSS